MASRLRIAGLAAAILAISLLRYITGSSSTLLHEVMLNLYYLPILVGAYWYGVTGGLVIASVSAVMYLNRATQFASSLDPARLAEIAFFHLVATVVGMLANAQRRANEELRASYEQMHRIDRLRTLGEVATGLAHEIRHPLASIGGAVEIIESRSSPQSPEAEFSRLAMSEVRRLDKLVREFLRYARPHDPELRLVPMHDVVVQATTLLQVEADRAGVSLTVDAADTDLTAYVDPLQMEQVLLNVILNAIQATPRGGRVTVQEGSTGSDIWLEVVDEGPGIAPEHIPRIFDPFFTTREQGTGLGLAIANRIAASHDGRVEIVRTASDGTRFRIVVPVAGPARMPAGRAAVATAL